MHGISKNRQLTRHGNEIYQVCDIVVQTLTAAPPPRDELPKYICVLFIAFLDSLVSFIGSNILFFTQDSISMYTYLLEQVVRHI